LDQSSARPARGLVVSASASVLVASVLVGRAGSYQDLVDWYCRLLTRRTVYGKSCSGHKQNTKTTRVKMNPEIVQNSDLALQDHCSYKAPTTNRHITLNRLLLFTLCVGLLAHFN